MQVYEKHPRGFSRPFLPSSEQSHFINVFAPARTRPEDRLPVLVFVYGGALANGSSSGLIYDPTEWIRRATQRPAIIVTFEYRVGILGFLASPGGHVEGNFGLHDCVAAFEWVRDEIEHFGGDPENVTAIRQSAGAFLVSHLCVAGRHLFRRAILQSGAPETLRVRPSQYAYPPWADILADLGVPEGWREEQQVAALLEVDAGVLVHAHGEHAGKHGFGALGLTEGGELLAPAALRRLAAGDLDEWIEGVILGTTKDEGGTFARAFKLNSRNEFAKYLWSSTFPAHLREQIWDLYWPRQSERPPAAWTDRDCPAAELIGDKVILFPVLRFADAVASRDRRRKVYVYQLQSGIRYIEETLELGVKHGVDAPLLFGTSFLWQPGDPEGRISALLEDLWLSFAATGEPDEAWKPWRRSRKRWMCIGPGSKQELVDVDGYKSQKREVIGEVLDWE